MTDLALTYDPTFVLLLLTAMLLGGLVKGAIGLGLPLITIPLLALEMPPTQAIGVMMLPVLATNLWQAVTCGSYSATLARFWPMIIMVLVMSAAGTTVLVNIDVQAARLVLGITVIAAVSIQVLAAGRLTLPRRLERPTGVAVAFVAGFLGGMSNAFGPPLVIYLLSLRMKPLDFLSALAMLFLAGGLPLYTGLVLSGEFRQQELVLSLLAGIPVGLGMVLGSYLRHMVPEVLFRRCVMAVLILVGLSLILRP